MFNYNESEVEKAATTENENALAICEASQGISVKSPEDLMFAMESIREVKSKAKALETERKDAIDPLKKVIDKINGWFKPAIKAYTDAESHLKSQIVGYREAQELARQRALAEAAKAVKKNNTNAAEKALALAAQSAPQKIEGASMREVWTFEVVDANLVPREFLCVDEKALGAYVRARKEEAKIPGVRVFSQKSLAVELK